jgi:hypothetical protein
MLHNFRACFFYTDSDGGELIQNAHRCVRRGRDLLGLEVTACSLDTSPAWRLECLLSNVAIFIAANPSTITEAVAVWEQTHGTGSWILVTSYGACEEPFAHRHFRRIVVKGPLKTSACISHPMVLLTAVEACHRDCLYQG